MRVFNCIITSSADVQLQQRQYGFLLELEAADFRVFCLFQESV